MKRLALLLMFVCLTCPAGADGEIHVPYWTDSTLYLVRFQSNGDAFLADGLSDEVWGTGGRDASDYAIAMAESGSSGHYVGNFDTLTNIGEGTYYFDIFVQAGGSPADTDQPAGFWGSIRWTGTAEDRRAVVGDVTDAHSATDAKIDTTDALITSKHSDTDGKIDTTDALITSKHSTTDDHLTDIKGTSFVKDTHSLIDLWTLSDWMRDVMEGDVWTNTATTPWRMEIRTKGTASALIEKELLEIDGTDITAVTQRIGQKTEP